MKPVVLHTEAETELEQAVDFHNGRRAGLGDELLEEVNLALSKIEQEPEIYPRYSNTSHRTCLVRRFPYVIYFRVLKEYTLVHAIAHGAQRPGYWIRRTT